LELRKLPQIVLDGPVLAGLQAALEINDDERLQKRVAPRTSLSAIAADGRSLATLPSVLKSLDNLFDVNRRDGGFG
jgi:hypothetical protein